MDVSPPMILFPFWEVALPLSTIGAKCAHWLLSWVDKILNLERVPALFVSELLVLSLFAYAFVSAVPLAHRFRQLKPVLTSAYHSCYPIHVCFFIDSSKAGLFWELGCSCFPYPELESLMELWGGEFVSVWVVPKVASVGLITVEGQCSFLWQKIPHSRQIMCRPLYSTRCIFSSKTNLDTKGLVRPSPTLTLANFPWETPKVLSSNQSVRPIWLPNRAKICLS